MTTLVAAEASKAEAAAKRALAERAARAKVVERIIRLRKWNYQLGGWWVIVSVMSGRSQ